MPNLNFYDTDAVKAFVLNILVENEELRQSVDFERRSSNAWFQDYKTQKDRADSAEAKVAELENTESDTVRVDAWFEDYRKEQKRAEAAEAKVAELENTADALAAERDAALAQKGGVTE